jgi:hypothetical protein
LSFQAGSVSWTWLRSFFPNFIRDDDDDDDDDEEEEEDR